MAPNWSAQADAMQMVRHFIALHQTDHDACCGTHRVWQRIGRVLHLLELQCISHMSAYFTLCVTELVFVRHSCCTCLLYDKPLGCLWAAQIQALLRAALRKHMHESCAVPSTAGHSLRQDTSAANAGFVESTASRQGKQPPEASCVLPDNPQALQNVAHALRMLQMPFTPKSTDAKQQPSPEQTSHDTPKTADTGLSISLTAQLNKSAPDDAELSPTAHHWSSTTSDPTVAEAVLLTDATPLSTSAQAASAGGSTIAAAVSAQGAGQPSSHAAKLQHSTPQSQMATNDLGKISESGSKTTAESSKPWSADRPDDQVSETGNAEMTSPLLATKPVTEAMKSSSLQESTPAVAQEYTGVTPAAPQHAVRPRLDAAVSSSVQKPLAFTPAAQLASVSAADMPSDQRAKSGQEAVPTRGDVATLIKEKFAELMSSKQYTPNEAAVLAVQHVSAAQQQ